MAEKGRRMRRTVMRKEEEKEERREEERSEEEKKDEQGGKKRKSEVRDGEGKLTPEEVKTHRKWVHDQVREEKKVEAMKGRREEQKDQVMRPAKEPRGWSKPKLE